MSPNPLDVQTIHASQNDGEARQWEFELHNNGELIDTSDVKEQLVFKAYKGGTEQLLPENGSTPTTAPFNGDIRYPQGLLTDQEFTYRQSPTEEDGLAKITDIKGQTLKWNQIFPTQTINYTGTGYTLTSASDGKFVLTVTDTASQDSSINHVWLPRTTFTPGHKYLLLGSDAVHGIDVYIKGYYVYMNRIWTAPSAMGANVNFMFNNLAPGTYNLYPMIFDLTAMGLESITDPSEFTSLFPLSYYAYNQGSLLSFNGNGIKTVGKNQVANVVRGYFSVGASAISVDNDSESFVFYAIKGKTYVSSSALTLNRNAIARCDTPNLVNGSPIYDVVNTSRTWTATWTGWTVWYVYSSRNEAVENSAQVEFGTTATAYEPYTESVINLPISTYFPSGMKSIEPNQYTTVEITDELVPTKATTRVGSITIDGNTPMSPNGATSEFSAFIMPINGKANGAANIMSDLFEVGSGKAYTSYGRAGNNNVEFYLPPSVPQTVADAHAWFAQHPTTLYFELATPTETSFTTASLVTENGEVALANENGVLVGKCNSDVSADAGFIEGKIKLSDSDGDVYSNKIQIHVERSPQ